MLFGFVAILLPPAPSGSRRYVPAHTTFLLKKRHPCLYHSSTCASAASACGSRPALSTVVAMSRAMAMTALINKLTSRPFVFFGMFHPSPRDRRRQRLTRCGTRLLAAPVPEPSRESPGLGQPPGPASAAPLRIPRPPRFCTPLCSSPSAPPWVHSG